MNDGKFTLALLDEKTGMEMPLPAGCRLAIVKMSNREAIPEDEPVHIFRARDKYALPALRGYLAISMGLGCNDYHERGVKAQIRRFVMWGLKNADKLKVPGLTRGA
jgi:hypothetical protein